MRTVGLKLESSVFTATMAKIIRKYQELPISQIKQIVSNNDYVYKCDIIRANGIKTLSHVKKDLSKERINSYIYVEGKLTSEEYLNNLLVSYKQTEEQVEEENNTFKFVRALEYAGDDKNLIIGDDKWAGSRAE